MDVFLSGLLGAFFADPAGRYFGGLSYSVALVRGLIIGVLLNALTISYAAFNSSPSKIASRLVDEYNSGNIIGIIVIFSAIPFISMVTAVIMRLLTPPPSWSEFLDLVGARGYKKSGCDNECISYTKGRDVFLATSPLNGIPSRVEWWRDGERRGWIDLRSV